VTIGGVWIDDRIYWTLIKTRDYTVHITIPHRVFSLTLLGSGFPFLCIPELTPASTTSFKLLIETDYTLAVVWPQSSNKGYSSCPYGSRTAPSNRRLTTLVMVACPHYIAPARMAQKTPFPTVFLLLRASIVAIT
jgi:hypothetical protein